MGMQLRGPFSRRRVAAGWHDHQRCVATAYRRDDLTIAMPYTLLREREFAVAISRGYVHTGEIEHDVGICGVEYCRQMLLKQGDILSIADPVMQRNVQV